MIFCASIKSETNTLSLYRKDGGFWIAKPTQFNIELWEKALQLSLEWKFLELEQHSLNFALNVLSPGAKYSRKFLALSKLLFASGWYLNRYRLNDKLRVLPLVAHMNWLMGTQGKKQTMKEMNMWYIGEDFSSK